MESNTSMNSSLYQKYADTFRKSSNEYYHKHKEEISAKRKQKYLEKKALKPPKEKLPPKNYYQEVYKIRRIQKRIENIKDNIGLTDEQAKILLDKYNVFLNRS